MAELQALSRLYLFQGVPQDDLRAFVQAFTLRHLARGAVVCRQGDPARYGWLVVEGCLLAHLDTCQGEVPVGDIREGEIAGETALYLDGAVHSGTVIASRHSLCLELEPDKLAQLEDNRAVLALERHLMGTVARRIRATNLHLQQELEHGQALHGATGLVHRLRSLLGGSP